MKKLLRFLGVSSLAGLGVLAAQAQPANNNFANRITISGTTINVTGSNVGANKETGEPNHAGNIGGASVWWTWTAPGSSQVVIDTIGSTYNTLLAVYTGPTVNGLTEIASNNNINGNQNTRSRVTFNAVAGTVYQIAVDGNRGNFGAVATGTIQLNLAMSVNVTITEPANGSLFGLGNPITISASGTPLTPPITQIDFYRGGRS